MNNPVFFNDPSGRVAVPAAIPWDAVHPLAKLLPTLATGLTAVITAGKTAAATSLIPIVGKAALAATVIAIGSVAYQVASYMAAANQATAWALAQVAAGGVTHRPGTHSVYVLYDTNRSHVFYVGRTTNPASRLGAHNKDPRFVDRTFRMVPVATRKTLDQARVLEQALIAGFTLNALDNMINSIAPWRLDLERFQNEWNRAQLLMSGLLN